MQSEVGRPLIDIDRYNEWTKGEGILVTSTNGFKGLQADVVLLYDICSEGFEWFQEKRLYIACTRAKHTLIVLTVEGGKNSEMVTRTVK